MLIFATVVILLALSNESNAFADNGLIRCDCWKVLNWDSMDAELKDVRSIAKYVTESYTKVVQQRAPLHMSHYKIDLFIMECDSLFLAAREEINALIAKQDRGAPPDCASIIESAQDIINDLSDKTQCLTSELLVLTNVHPTIYPNTGSISLRDRRSHRPSQPRNGESEAKISLKKHIKCAQNSLKRIGFKEGKRETELTPKIDKIGGDCGRASKILEEYLDALRQDYKQDLCAEIEYDIANNEEAPPFDKIILAAVGTYRLEFERLKSKFSATIDKPSSYPYLNLRFSSDIERLLREAEEKLNVEIKEWKAMLESYHEYQSKKSLLSALGNKKSRFLTDCRGRADAKAVFATFSSQLTRLYRDELVFVPIVIELRSFDQSQRTERREQLIQEFHDQFNASPSEYLKSAEKIAEREKFNSHKNINWSRLGGSGFSRPSDDLWDDSLYYCEGDYLKQPNLWLGEPLAYRTFVENANVLNDYALREFALARIYGDKL